MTHAIPSVHLFISISDSMRRLVIMLLGFLAMLAGIECALRVLPTSTYSDTGYHIDPLIMTYRPGRRFRTSWGWDFSQPQQHEANNLGFLASRDFRPDPNAVALIGDSFVDGSMLPDAERVGSRLQKVLGARPVYAMGGPGSSLLDYAERVRYAAEHLDVRDFVIVLERGDVRQAYCGSGNIHGPCLDRATGSLRTQLQPPASAFKLYARHSALMQYLVGHLGFDPVQRGRQAWAHMRSLRVKAGGSVSPTSTVAPVTKDYSPEELARVAEVFFSHITPYRGGRLLMVFDCDRGALKRGEPPSDAARDQMMALARANGAEVIDTAPSFGAYLATSGRYLEVSPLDAHWNREATALVAAEIAAVLAR
jgi:hypothetical protein